MARQPQTKPQGKTGPIRLSSAEASWETIDFPAQKAPRELMIAEMFVKAANRLIMSASPNVPSFTPFTNLIQNEENDLDFTVTTSAGVKRMDIAEFAPLDVYGPTFDHAPKQLSQSVKADLAFKLIQNKSAHQGGKDRLLLLYKTEQAFFIDPVTTEILRRMLLAEPPKFDRVYYLSPHNITEGSVSEIYPGKPHHSFGDAPDAQLHNMRVQCFHPEDLTIGWEGQMTHSVTNYGLITLRLRTGIQAKYAFTKGNRRI